MDNPNAAPDPKIVLSVYEQMAAQNQSLIATLQAHIIQRDERIRELEQQLADAKPTNKNGAAKTKNRVGKELTV